MVHTRVLLVRHWVLAALVLAATVADAAPLGQAARKAGKAIARTAGRQSAKQAGSQAQRAAARHGDDAIRAIARLQPAGRRAIEKAGPYADDAVRLAVRHGDRAVWIMERPRGLALFARYGDDAAKAMLRHRGVATTTIEGFGSPAARALQQVSGQNARRLAMMTNDGTLRRMGRADELLEITARYGDRAMDFVWRHKGSLTISTVLAAFLADPEPFLSGAKDLAAIGADAAVAPLAEVPGTVATEAARSVNWTLVVVLAMLLVASGLFVRGWRTSRKHRRSP